jgi:hypothetical protein
MGWKLCLIVLLLAARPALADLSDNERAQLSEGMLKKITEVDGQATEVDATTPLGAMFGRLAAALPRVGSVRLRLFTTPGSALRIFALPDGRVLVSKGLLDLVPRVDLLAFLLAHEIVHVDAQDAVHQVGKRGPSIGSVISAVGGVAHLPSWTGWIGTVGDRLIRVGYPLPIEKHADVGALDLLRRAGIAPRSALAVLDLLRNRTVLGQGSIALRRGDVEAWVASHRETAAADDAVIVQPGSSAEPVLTAWHLLDARGKKTDDVYAPDEPFQLVLDLHAARGRRLEILWRYGDMRLHEVDRVLADLPTFSATLRNKNPWREGEYVAQVYIDGKAVATIHFRVIATPPRYLAQPSAALGARPAGQTDRRAPRPPSGCRRGREPGRASSLSAPRTQGDDSGGTRVRLHPPARKSSIEIGGGASRRPSPDHHRDPFKSLQRGRVLLLVDLIEEPSHSAEHQKTQ